jgi:penicillin amidase
MSFTCYRDAWGIPHLRASDPLSLAYAQGRNAAVDRAWQLETLRRRATGTSAALLGAEWLPWDRLIRQVNVAAVARSAFDALDPATADWVGAYVDGINAALPAAAAADPGYAAEPTLWEPWTPLAVWHAEHLLFGSSFPAKFWRRRVCEYLGDARLDQLAMDGFAHIGSNGWLVDASHTATGAPILAGDPHRFIQLPGAYQQIRLACEGDGEGGDGFDVVGLAMPGIPGIAHFGHTGTVAWGITNAMADTQDLFVEQLRRNADGTVEARGLYGWEPARTRTETIEVAGGAAETLEVVETARGPIIAEVPNPNAWGPEGEPRPHSLSSPVRLLDDLGFSALPKLLRARTVTDVDLALHDWVLPVNVVMAADTAGGLLHRVAGRVPERPDVNLVHPMGAAKAHYVWRDWKPMPRAAVDGIAVMANDRGLAAPLGIEFCAPHRADRIRELLDARTDWSAADMAAVHTDTYLPTAGLLLDLLPGLALDGPAAALRERLLAWDRRMDAGSTEAAAFADLRHRFIGRLAEHPVFAGLDEPSGVPALFEPWLALRPRIGLALGPLLNGDLVPDDDRDAALTAAIEAVAAEAPRTWGELHRLFPWQDGAEPEALPGMSGDTDCVLSTSGVFGVTDDFTRGPAARWVWDLADREQSRWIVPFGASGANGPHARDQFPLWQRGELARVVTDWNRLQEEHRMIDRPSVFEQKVEDFGLVAIVPVRPAEDLDLIYGWVTEERAKFWGMTEHSREYVLEIYEYLDSLATHHAFLVLRDGEPSALFQTYEPDADPVGECYEVEPGDIGAHLFVAPPSGESQAGFTGVLMSVFTAYLFADPEHRRIVVEPDVRNERAANRMRRSGFTFGPEIRLPDKTARLAFLRREDTPFTLT